MAIKPNAAREDRGTRKKLTKGFTNIPFPYDVDPFIDEFLKTDIARKKLGIKERPDLLRLIFAVIEERAKKMHIDLNEPATKKFVYIGLKNQEYGRVKPYTESKTMRQLGVTSHPTLFIQGLRNILSETDERYAKLAKILDVSLDDLLAYKREHPLFPRTEF